MPLYPGITFVGAEHRHEHFVDHPVRRGLPQSAAHNSLRPLRLWRGQGGLGGAGPLRAIGQLAHFDPGREKQSPI